MLAINVRFRDNSGHRLILAGDRLSAYDPKRTFVGLLPLGPIA